MGETGRNIFISSKDSVFPSYPVQNIYIYIYIYIYIFIVLQINQYMKE